MRSLRGLRSLRFTHLAVLFVVLVTAGCASVQTPSTDPLPSWNEGKVKQSIVAFVAKVTTPGSPDFVAASRTSCFIEFYPEN